MQALNQRLAMNEYLAVKFLFEEAQPIWPSSMSLGKQDLTSASFKVVLPWLFPVYLAHWFILGENQQVIYLDFPPKLPDQ